MKDEGVMSVPERCCMPSSLVTGAVSSTTRADDYSHPGLGQLNVFLHLWIYYTALECTSQAYLTVL